MKETRRYIFDAWTSKDLGDSIKYDFKDTPVQLIPCERCPDPPSSDRRAWTKVRVTIEEEIEI